MSQKNGNTNPVGRFFVSMTKRTARGQFVTTDELRALLAVVGISYEALLERVQARLTELDKAAQENTNQGQQETEKAEQFREQATKNAQSIFAETTQTADSVYEQAAAEAKAIFDRSIAQAAQVRDQAKYEAETTLDEKMDEIMDAYEDADGAAAWKLHIGKQAAEGAEAIRSLLSGLPAADARETVEVDDPELKATLEQIARSMMHMTETEEEHKEE